MAQQLQPRANPWPLGSIGDTMNRPLDTIWYTRGGHPSPLGLAAQLGWFFDEFNDDGIKVFTLQESGNAQLRESHFDHHLLNSFRQGGSGPAIWARARGGATRVIGLNWLDEYQCIVTLPGSGIRSARDLRGRRLSLPRYPDRFDSRRAQSLRGFAVALELGGVSTDEVQFIDVTVDKPYVKARGSAFGAFGEYAEQVAALRQGHVDVLFVKGGRGLRTAQELQAQTVVDIRNHPDPLVRANNGTPRPITVDQSLLDQRPDIVARFLARVVAVGAWSESHPAETLMYVSRETQCQEAWVRQAYGEDLHLHQHTQFSDTAIRALDTYKNFLLRWGFIARDFDTAGWIEPTPLSQVLARNNRRLRMASTG